MVGQVVFPSTNGKEPIAGAVIEMSEDNDDGRTIERATTDESGHFAFNNIKAGKYKLIATAPHLHTLVVKVQITKALRGHRRYILIALGAKPLEPCGGGYARTQNAK